MKKVYSAVVMVPALLLFWAGEALAQTAPPDPTGGQFGTTVDSVQGFVTGTVAGKLFLLAAAIIGIVVGLRWLNKVRTQAT